MEVAFWMLVFGIVFDYLGFGKRQWANRVAALLALGAMVRLLAPSRLGQSLRGWAQDAMDMAAQVVGSYDPQWGRLIGSLGLAAIALVVTLVWAAKFLPKNTPHAGEAVSAELDSKWIWGGAAVVALFVSVIPGPIGEVLVTIAGLGVQLAETGTQNVVALAVAAGVA